MALGYHSITLATPMKNLPRPYTKTLLPVVKRGVTMLDQLLLEYTGPVGVELSQDAFLQWLNTGRTRPSDLRHYMDHLAGHIDDRLQKKLFLEKANSLLLRLQTGLLATG